jgi:putative membrane protein
MEPRNEPRPSFEPGVIRDRLANERTLLAWVRTALALMAFGVAVERFAVFIRGAAVTTDAAELPDPVWSQAIGLVLVLLGGVVAVSGGWRTRAWAAFIDPEHRGPSDLVLALTAALSVVLSGVLAVYLLAA